MTNDEIREAVVGALTRVAPEVEPASIRRDLALRDQLDIDSMDFLNFVIALHERLGVDIPEVDYARLSSVDAIVAPIPLELHAFGLASTLARLGELGPVAPRPDTPPSPDAGVIADYTGPVSDPGALAARLAAVPGVVDHGLFPAAMVSDVIIGRDDAVERA